MLWIVNSAGAFVVCHWVQDTNMLTGIDKYSYVGQGISAQQQKVVLNRAPGKLHYEK